MTSDVRRLSRRAPGAVLILNSVFSDLTYLPIPKPNKPPGVACRNPQSLPSLPTHPYVPPSHTRMPLFRLTSVRLARRVGVRRSWRVGAAEVESCTTTPLGGSLDPRVVLDAPGVGARQEMLSLTVCPNER